MHFRSMTVVECQTGKRQSAAWQQQPSESGKTFQPLRFVLIAGRKSRRSPPGGWSPRWASASCITAAIAGRCWASPTGRVSGWGRGPATDPLQVFHASTHTHDFYDSPWFGAHPIRGRMVYPRINQRRACAGQGPKRSGLVDRVLVPGASRDAVDRAARPGETALTGTRLPAIGERCRGFPSRSPTLVLER